MILFLYILTFITPVISNSLTFTQRTGVSNPANGIDIGSESTPYLIDIDNDNDFDLFIGNSIGLITYYENIGTSVIPNFILRDGIDNPANSIDVGDRAAPNFIDIDNDNDFDLFIGNSIGLITYYENIGSVSNPLFVLRTGVSNPFDGIDVGNLSVPYFIDIDNDIDYDVFIGDNSGVIYFYENTGNISNPNFVLKTGAQNPLNSIDVGVRAAPSFIDIDKDSDYDLFIGNFDGNIRYFENIGSLNSANFIQRNGINNPFDGVNVGNRAAPNFIDIDSDSDNDLFIGNNQGLIVYYDNESIFAPEIYNFIATPINTSVSFSFVLSPGGITTTYSINYGIEMNNYLFNYSSTVGAISSTLNVIFQTSQNISSGTRYYARASATNSISWTQSDEIVFTTLDMEVVSSDRDSDGIENDIENEAPNNGDGNNDGILDSEQTNVVSLIIKDEYVTIEVLGNCDSIYDAAEKTDYEENKYSYILGQLEFKLPCSNAQVKLYFHGTSDLSNYTYRKLFPDETYLEFENVVFSTETIGGNRVAVATLTLTDGGPGDYDGIVNGVIYDPGGPAIPITANIPIWDWWYSFLVIPIFIIIYRKLSN